RLDGAALDQWSSDVLGRYVGYLPQDVELFAGSVAQNICRFDPNAGSDTIIAAAKEAGVHEMIIKMRDGYDTQTGEQGTALSAGCAAQSHQDRIRWRRCQIMSGSEKKGSLQSIRLHLIIGLAVVVILAGGLGGWASTAQISGALIAPGSVVVESNVKKVQHPTGGVVGELRARDGDVVKAGDVVVRLDDTVTKASLAIVTKNLDG